MPIFVAFKKGFYRDEEMDVEIINMSSQMVLTATLAGSVDFSSSPGSGTSAPVRGIDFKTIFEPRGKYCAKYHLTPKKPIVSSGLSSNQLILIQTQGGRTPFSYGTT